MIKLHFHLDRDRNAPFIKKHFLYMAIFKKKNAKVLDC